MIENNNTDTDDELTPERFFTKKDAIVEKYEQAMDNLERPKSKKGAYKLSRRFFHDPPQVFKFVNKGGNESPLNAMNQRISKKVTPVKKAALSAHRKGHIILAANDCSDDGTIFFQGALDGDHLSMGRNDLTIKGIFRSIDYFIAEMQKNPALLTNIRDSALFGDLLENFSEIASFLTKPSVLAERLRALFADLHHIFSNTRNNPLFHHSSMNGDYVKINVILMQLNHFLAEILDYPVILADILDNALFADFIENFAVLLDNTVDSFYIGLEEDLRSEWSFTSNSPGCG
ncbi:MAG: hypothetical protein Q8R24_11030 [Legionellaceae bacterium]|nr:hypothetical protein [Legionellaceae bacterium]